MSKLLILSRHSGIVYKGFTLIEVISVILLLGIFSAVTLSNSFSSEAYRAYSEVDTFDGHLRYAQLRALGDDLPWGMAITANSYQLFRGSVSTSVNLPDSNSSTHKLQDVTVTSGTGSILFDQWGSPGTSNIVVQFSNGQSLVVWKNTGFIR